MSGQAAQPDQATRPTRSLADLAGLPADAQAPASLPASAWAKAAVIAALFSACNWWQYRNLVTAWRANVNWSHGFLIPLFSLYLLYARRTELLRSPRRSCLWGLPVMVLGILATLVSFYPLSVPWFYELSMLVVMLGLVLYLAGPKVFAVVCVPILYLALAMPIPDRLYEAVAVQLQTLAAKSSAAVLSAFGAQVQSNALQLKITSLSGKVHSLLVAEACSGVRSLMAFMALSVAMAYVEPRPGWQRLTLILAGFPIAVVCNILRVVLTGTMFLIDKPELGQKIMHELMGMVLLIPALGLLILLNRLLDSFYVEEDDAKPGGDAPPAQEAAES